MKEPDLIVFGGTFDPPHTGHEAVLRNVRGLFRNSKIVIVPAFKPPISAAITSEEADLVGSRSATRSKAVALSFDERLSLCSVAFASLLEEGRLEISSLERELPKPSYTIQTLSALRNKENAQKIALVIGQDHLGGIHQWHKADELLYNLDLVVAPRSNQDDAALRKDHLVRTLAKLAHDGGLGSFTITHRYVEFPSRDLRVWLMPSSASMASSTAIRDHYRFGGPFDESWLHAEVKRIIEANGYYR
jgi:nicotinate-nucleotide adenylyltransferase